MAWILESCKNVEIVGVYFSLGDDCIAVKAGKIYMGAKYKRPCEKPYDPSVLYAGRSWFCNDRK